MPIKNVTAISAVTATHTEKPTVFRVDASTANTAVPIIGTANPAEIITATTSTLIPDDAPI